jgi:heme-degrading monooxygenase HmoA
VPEHVIVWSFRVEPAREARFTAAYGPGGDWARLFRRGEGYLGSQLVRCEEAGRYLSIDRWASKAAFDAFLERYAAEYDELDERFEELTVIEALIAAGEVLAQS